jgi:hypothetical protein
MPEAGAERRAIPLRPDRLICRLDPFSDMRTCRIAGSGIRTGLGERTVQIHYPRYDFSGDALAIAAS